MDDDKQPEFPEYFLAAATMLIAMMNIAGRDQKGVALVEELYQEYAHPKNWLSTYTSWNRDGESLLSTDTSDEAVERFVPVLQEMSRPRARALLRQMRSMAARDGVFSQREADFYNRLREILADKIPYFDPEAEKHRKLQYEPIQPGTATAPLKAGDQNTSLLPVAIVVLVILGLLLLTCSS